MSLSQRSWFRSQRTRVPIKNDPVGNAWNASHVPVCEPCSDAKPNAKHASIAMSASHFCPGQATSKRYDGVAWGSNPPETIWDRGCRGPVGLFLFGRVQHVSSGRFVRAS